MTVNLIKIKTKFKSDYNYIALVAVFLEIFRTNTMKLSVKNNLELSINTL